MRRAIASEIPWASSDADRSQFWQYEGYCEAKKQGGEAQSKFWTMLMSFLKSADLEPCHCFLTNALMGLKPGKACGEMPDHKTYREQCRRFLAQQVEVVKPRALITLSGKSRNELQAAIKNFPELGGLPKAHVAHPSTWPKDRKPDEQSWIALQAEKIKAAADAAISYSVLS